MIVDEGNGQMAAQHRANGSKPSVSPIGSGSKRDLSSSGAKGIGATPHSGLVAYAKGVHHAKTPHRGSTKTLSR